MNNTTNIQDIIKKLPITLFFSEQSDRKQSLKYINWLYDNIPQSKTVVQDKFFREVICQELRIVSMKITEIEILFMIALKTIVIEDFTLDSESLIKKIIAENPDKNDLDLMYRILAQIMTKLPMDLRDKVSGKHKMQIFQSISKFITMEPKLLERFMSFNPSLNTPITMELDGGDYNTLNKKYLDELKKFQDSQPYINSDSMEYSKIANNMMQKMPNLSNSNSNIKGQYIDSSPDLMMGTQDNKLYYFDSSSGTISEFPISGKEQIPVNMTDLTNVLVANKVDKNQIDDLILKLQSNTQSNTNVPNDIPTTTHPISFLNSIFYKSNNSTDNSSIFSKMFQQSGNSSPTSPPSAPVPTSIPSTPSAPVPPQYILSQNTQNTQQPAQYQNYLLNPSITIPKDFVIQPQQTSNFLTRNDVCSLPNPPASCPKKTTPSPNIFNPDLEAKYKERASTYQQISHFSNMNSKGDDDLIKKLSKNNKDIENVAIAFVSIIVLLFILVIFNSIRNKNGLS